MRRTTRILVTIVLVLAAATSSLVGGLFLVPAMVFASRRKERHTEQLLAVSPGAMGRDLRLDTLP